MKELQEKELQKIVKFVEAIGCKYKIITVDGREFGSLNVTEEKVLKRKMKRPWGDLAKFYKTKLKFDCPVGEVQEVECGDYEPRDVRGAICSHLGKVWGNGTYATCVKDGKVEILRTA